MNMKYSTIDDLPNILYFASQKKLKNVKGPVFLSPYIGIASIFIANGKMVLRNILEDRFGSYLEGYRANVSYKEWNDDDSLLLKPLNFVHMKHNIAECPAKYSGSSSGYIYEIDISNIRTELKTFVTNDPNREVTYYGDKAVTIKNIIPHSLKWSMEYDPNMTEVGELFFKE